MGERREMFLRYRTCARKRRYEHKQDAMKIVEDMIHSRNFVTYQKHILRVYRCKFGNHYHIGKAKKPREMILNYPDGWEAGR